MKKYVWPDNGRTNRAFPDPDGGPLSQENWRETGRETGLRRPTFPCLCLSLRQAPDSFSGPAVEEQKPRARLFCFLPEWRNGRRSRLKICRQQCREGSTPSSGTILTSTGQAHKACPFAFPSGHLFPPVTTHVFGRNTHKIPTVCSVLILCSTEKRRCQNILANARSRTLFELRPAESGTG